MTRDIIAYILAALAVVLLLTAAAFIPYILYIGFHYGWSDNRLMLAPLGALACILAIGIFRLACFVQEMKCK